MSQNRPPTAQNSSDDLLPTECRDDVLVMTPSGNLGEFVVGELESETQNVLNTFETSGCNHLVIDFCNTDYFGSSALGMFVRIWKKVQQRKGTMALCNLTAHEVEVLKVTRLNEFWQIRESLPEALALTKD